MQYFFFSSYFASNPKRLQWCLFAALPAVFVYTVLQYDVLFASAAWKHTIRAQKTILRALETVNMRITKSVSKCTDFVCSSFLPPWDMKAYASCTEKVRTTYGKPPVDDCKFRNGTGKSTIALVSLPGSGNTWTRGLLQKVTGICTGSIVCDSSLRYEGFTGEGVHSASVLVTKSHDSSLRWSERQNSVQKHGYTAFDGAIFLIRNPFHSIVSEWNRKFSKENLGESGNHHIKYAGKEAFGEPTCSNVGEHDPSTK